MNEHEITNFVVDNSVYWVVLSLSVIASVGWHSVAFLFKQLERLADNDDKEPKTMQITVTTEDDSKADAEPDK